jgi:lipoprotein-releasing system ATP-binding protein
VSEVAVGPVPREQTSPAARVVLSAKDLCKTYTGKIDTPVLLGIDFEVREGEFVAVMGQSGSGKSTLLNILGCLDRPTSGYLEIDGQEIAMLNDDELAHLRSRSIGFVFQFHFLLDEFTCLENVLMPILIAKGKVSRQERDRMVKLTRRMGLASVLDHTPDTMSGGQNQRCAIVRALANNPRVVLADEPTGNLDRRAGEEVFATLREMNKESGTAVVLVTHDDRLAREADRIVVIEDGMMREIRADELYSGRTGFAHQA